MRADTGTALDLAVNKRLFILARSVPLGRWKPAGHASIITCRVWFFNSNDMLCCPSHGMHAEQQGTLGMGMQLQARSLYSKACTADLRRPAGPGHLCHTAIVLRSTQARSKLSCFEELQRN